MNKRIAATALLLAPLLLPAGVRAESEVNLYKLCTQFPLNSRCEGYEPPVALEARPGEEGICAYQLDQLVLAGECKIVLTEEGITLYIEDGDRLEVLDDERPTREVNVPFDRVASLSYRETKRIRTGEYIGSTLLFGLPGLLGAALFSRPKKLSQIDIGFATAPAIALVEDTPAPTEPTAGSPWWRPPTVAPVEDTPAPTEPTATSPQPAGQLTLVTEREIGGVMRLRLEQFTGMVAEVPPEEEEEDTSAQAGTPPEDIEPTDMESFCASFPYNSRCQETVR